LTAIENAGNERLTVPSLTLIETLAYVPTWLAVGVPDTPPVEVLNVAQLGALATLKVRVSPSASAAVGWKL
jgi:hypothetical protein